MARATQVTGGPRTRSACDAALIAIPGRGDVAAAEAPGDSDGRPAAAGGEAAVLPALVVEATQADAVGRLVVAAARTVADVMDFKVAPRGAAGRRAAPAVANVDLVARAARCHDGDAFDDVRTGERSDARLNCSDRATELPMRETLNSGRDFP